MLGRARGGGAGVRLLVMDWCRCGHEAGISIAQCVVYSGKYLGASKASCAAQLLYASNQRCFGEKTTLLQIVIGIVTGVRCAILE